jgi:hypothetical protein
MVYRRGAEDAEHAEDSSIAHRAKGGGDAMLFASVLRLYGEMILAALVAALPRCALRSERA